MDIIAFVRRIIRRFGFHRDGECRGCGVMPGYMHTEECPIMALFHNTDTFDHDYDDGRAMSQDRPGPSRNQNILGLWSRNDKEREREYWRYKAEMESWQQNASQTHRD